MGKERGKYHFGSWGWRMVIFSFICFLIYTLFVIDSVNIYPAAFAMIHGWNANTILKCSSIGGWCSAVGAFLFNDLVTKRGVRFIVTVTGIILGAVVLLFSRTDSFLLFVTAIIVINFIGGSVMVTAAPSTLLNNWFPKKNSLAFGVAVMGMPFSALVVIPLMQLGFSRIGAQNTFTIAGLLVMIFSVSAWFWVKNSPEEVGQLPDNEPITEPDPEAVRKEEQALQNAAREYTIPNLIKNRNTWCIGVGFGLIWLSMIGIVGQMIPRFMSDCGFSAARATMMFSIASAIGVFSSFFWGWFAYKITTKYASVLSGFWFVLTLIVLMLPAGPVMNWVAICVIGMSLGTVGNLIPSLIGSCFGRHGYPFASRIISVLNNVLRSTAFIVVASVLNYAGRFKIVYMVLIVFAAAGTVILFFVKMPEKNNG